MLKVCIVGCGMMFKDHLKHWQGNPDTEITSVVDINEIKAAEAQSTSGAEKRYTDYRTAIKDDIDIVDVALPHHLHAEVSIAAAHAGKHVFCEKPMAVTVQECEAMCLAAEESGVKLGIRFPRRADRSLKDLLAQGVIGRPYFASIECMAFVENKFLRDDWPLWNWMKRRECGGGVLSGPAPHYIDYLIWLMNSRVAAAYAVGSREMFMRDFAKDCNVEDTAIAVIWFQSGAVASVTCSWKVPGELANPFRIVGTRGSLVLHGKEIHVRGHDGQCKVMSLGGHSDKPTITDLFVRWITHGAPFPATGREAMETIKVLEAACRTMDAAWRLPASHKSSA